MADPAEGPSAPSRGPHRQLPPVKRSLFQSQLMRRSPVMPSSGGTEDYLRLTPADIATMSPNQYAKVTFVPHQDDETVFDAPSRESTDIVVRNRHGEVDLDDPPTPIMDDEEDQIVTDDAQEIERRQRVADAVKHHHRTQQTAPSQPEELLEAVKLSLRAKTAALAEDNWLYEREADLHRT